MIISVCIVMLGNLEFVLLYTLFFDVFCVKLLRSKLVFHLTVFAI